MKWRWPVTLLGVLAGLALASIPGAMLGGVLGHLVDRQLQGRGGSWRALPAGHELLFLLLGHLAKSNGRVLPVHIEQARAEMQRLALDEDGRRQAIEAFNQGKRGAQPRSAWFRPLQSRREEAEALLRACWRMALADQQVAPAERQLLLRWGNWLGWSEAANQALGMPARGVRQDDYARALQLLGVGESNSADEVRRAYRRLLSRHHPDKLAGAGASADAVQQATARTQALHQAYALVCRRQGWR